MDTVGDMLTTLVNAQRVGKERIAVPHSRFKQQLVTLLQEKGLVAKVRTKDSDKPKLIITLAYENGVPKVKRAARLSTPGRRRYVTNAQIPRRTTDLDMYVISTSKGLMDEVAARKSGLGGELICEVRI